MISYGGGFDDTVGTNVDMVTYFHGVVIKIAPVCLVRGSEGSYIQSKFHGLGISLNDIPHDTTFPNQAVST